MVFGFVTYILVPPHYLVPDILQFLRKVDFLQEAIQIAGKERIYVMRCVTWYNLYNLKNGQNVHEGVLLLVKLHAFSLQLYQK